jgi:hypothetical protein
MVPRDGASVKATYTTHDAGTVGAKEPMSESEEKRRERGDKEEKPNPAKA